VTKADGTKFGKTETGAVWLDAGRTSPYAFYQFWLRTVDADAGSYLRRFTMLGHEEIVELEKALAERPERREAQRALAAEMTAMVHGQDEADRAAAASEVLFTDKVASLDASTLSSALIDAPSTVVEAAELSGGLPVVEALVRTGLATSARNARQLLSQGSVYINGVRTSDGHLLALDDALHGRWIVLRRGRANQHVLVVTGTA
jgi:tyrosyl-tRNA synthetase